MNNKALDLFAGAGGWDVPATALGWDVDGAELMPEARATREAAGLKTPYGDVRKIEIVPGEYRLVIGSPPCQKFSMAGSGAGRRALDQVLHAVRSGAELTGVDEKIALVLEPLRLVLAGMPVFVAWEQVPPVLPVWQACAEVLREHGYSVWTGVLRAEQYGVPQTRKRAVLIARRDGIEAAPPTPTHSRFYERDRARLDPGVLPWVSMKRALGWDADVEVVSNYGTGGDPAARGRRFGHEPSATVTEKVGRNRVALTWASERPATPVQADPRIAAPGRRDRSPGSTDRQFSGETVRVTVEEAAALQTFPAGHPFQGGKGKRFLQVGNAVPCLLAEAILRTFVA